MALRQKETGVDSLTVDIYAEEESQVGLVSLSDYTLNLKMFSDDAPLKLKSIGWIQGKRKMRLKSITIWAIHPTLDNDQKYHLHISPNSYVGHRHNHHIVDKPLRTRKFAVRCVKDY